MLQTAFEFTDGEDICKDVRRICDRLGLPPEVLTQALHLASAHGLDQPTPWPGRLVSTFFGNSVRVAVPDHERWLAVMIAAYSSFVAEPSVAEEGGAPDEPDPTAIPGPQSMLLLVMPAGLLDPQGAGRTHSMTDLNRARAFWVGQPEELHDLEQAIQPSGLDSGETNRVTLVLVKVDATDARFRPDSPRHERRTALRDLPNSAEITVLGDIPEDAAALLALQPRNW